MISGEFAKSQLSEILMEVLMSLASPQESRLWRNVKMMCCLLVSMCNHFVFRQSPCVLAFLLGIFFLSIKSFSLMINQVSHLY